ncbi:MAG: flagellar filament capping protein FliD [Betaproteobacteria bacterium]|nr:flagellar filament capping protein FliD [Betaproteobacteria bacterium]
MASVTSLGVGSGLDLNSILTGLMNAERQPITILQQQQSTLQAQVSALGQIKSALSNLQSAADAINTSTSFSAFQTSSSDSSVLNATAGAGAVSGSYNIEVSQLAQAQKLKSAGFASVNSSIGTTGTLKIELGSASGGAFNSASSVDITIDPSNNTLAGLRDAINASGAGVVATIINDGGPNGSHLVLTSKDGGTANEIRLSGLDGFDYDSASGAGSLAQIQAGQDAKFTIDGISITKSSNTISDVIDGVTLNLSKTNVGSPLTLSVTPDTSAMTAKIQKFVDAYNSVITTLQSVSAYNADTKQGAALSGDYSVRTVQERMRSAVTGVVPGSPGGFSRLGDIGITLQADGTLGIDSDKLTAALSDPTKDASKIFTGVAGTDGIMTKVSASVTAMLDDSGVVGARTNGLNTNIKSLGDRIDSLNSQMDVIEARYRQQFTNLDTMISQLNSTGSYLLQQLAKM